MTELSAPPDFGVRRHRHERCCGLRLRSSGSDRISVAKGIALFRRALPSARDGLSFRVHLVVPVAGACLTPVWCIPSISASH